MCYQDISFWDNNKIINNELVVSTMLLAHNKQYLELDQKK